MSESVTLSADANVSLTNILDGILIDDKLVTKSSVRYEDTAVFSTGISVMKLESGTLKTDKNKQIKFTYKLPEGFTYVSNSSGQEPTIGEELVWLFDSNMNEDEDYYFNLNFTIVASLDTEIVPFTKVVNTATASIDFIDGSNQLKTADTAYIVTPNYEKEEAASFPDGAYASQFSSPSDSNGGSSGSQNNDIEVYPGALLGWNVYLTSLTATSPDVGLNSFDAFFYPDPNSKLVQFYSGDFFFIPSTAYKNAGRLPFDEPIQYSLSAKYKDEEGSNKLIGRAVEYGILRKIGNAHRDIFYQSDEIIKVMDAISNLDILKREND
ncbi:MAG: hypothetical protein GX074_05025 [Erysipelothrix sp.]|nr:hypothetical protein [Erysipelothrix sp.]